MKRYLITLDGRTFDVQLLDDPRQERVQVQVDGQSLTVEVKSASVPDEGNGVEAAPLQAPAVRAETSGPSVRKVTAPLPGTIKSIAARSDVRVAPGDVLLVIEAMKMDNVIRAPRAGVIGTVHAVEGRQVAHGELMLEYRD